MWFLTLILLSAWLEGHTGEMGALEYDLRVMEPFESQELCEAAGDHARETFGDGLADYLCELGT